MKILILGVNGMLGHKFLYHLAQNDQFEVIGTIRRKKYNFPSVFKDLNFNLITQLDCKDLKNIKQLVSEADVVLNSIAMIKQKTSVSPEEFLEVNGIFPHKLAQICWFSETRLIHISTDCVFSGKRGWYSEEDVPDPIDVYGVSKAVGEIRYGKNLTLRTSIIGTELETSYGLLEWFRQTEDESVSGFKKALWSGFTTDWLAELITRVILELPNLRGLYNIGTKKPIDKYSLLHLINDRFNLNKKISEDTSFVIDRSLNSELFFKITKFPRPTISQQVSRIFDLSD